MVKVEGPDRGVPTVELIGSDLIGVKGSSFVEGVLYFGRRVPGVRTEGPGIRGYCSGCRRELVRVYMLKIPDAGRVGSVCIQEGFRLQSKRAGFRNVDEKEPG